VTSHPAQELGDESCPIPLSRADELQLAQRLMSFDSSQPEGIRACTDYLKGWLEARDIGYSTLEADGLPILSAKLGEGPVTVVFHTHIDVVPGSEGQFIPHVDKDFLWGRGAYDMKGATAAMYCALADLAALEEPLPVAVRLLMVPDEESDKEQSAYGTEVLVEHGHVGDFVICGEPTDMHVGIEAKGVLDVRIEVEGRSAHGATPWLGVNAIARAMDVFDRLQSLPFAKESSQFYDRPSINLARIHAGDRLNLVPDRCTMEVDIRFLPEQKIERLREELASLPGCRLHEIQWRPPAKVATDNPFLQLLAGAAEEYHDGELQLVGRDGTNDGVHFLKRGIPSVEFGPAGSGHHGPEEKVSIRSLRQYRLALLAFLHRVAGQADQLAGSTVPHGLELRDEPRSLL
jgi:succinyl-diaminopimelate desuccinylase